MCLLLRSATRSLALAGVLAALSCNVQAAALMTLTGTTDEVKRGSEGEVRLSILGWTADEQQAAVVAEYQKYADSQDHAGFEKFLRGLDTKGYLFTDSPLGYTVKYAWLDSSSPQSKMVLMVVPALKKNNPYMWKTENPAATPFSLVEVQVAGDTATMKSSLDGTIAVTESGKLQLENYDSAQVFATLKDATPYYLKH
jgi:hypothetical protein